MEQVKIFEIQEYMVIWRQLELQNFNGVTVRLRAIVRCTGEGYTMDVNFLDPESSYPDPIYNIEEKKGHMFMPISDIASFVDVLRNEKPIYGHLRGDRPEWMSVTTGREPVGEGEG